MLSRFSNQIDRFLRFFTFRQRFLLFATTFLLCVPFPLYWVIIGQNLYIESARIQIENFNKQKHWNSILYDILRHKLLPKKNSLEEFNQKILFDLNKIKHNSDPLTSPKKITNLKKLIELSYSSELFEPSVQFEQDQRMTEIILEEFDFGFQGKKNTHVNLLPTNTFLNFLLSNLYQTQILAFYLFKLDSLLKNFPENKTQLEEVYQRSLHHLKNNLVSFQEQLLSYPQFQIQSEEIQSDQALADFTRLSNYLVDLNSWTLHAANGEEPPYKSGIDLIYENFLLTQNLIDYGLHFNQQKKNLHWFVKLLTFIMVALTALIILFYVFFHVLTSHFLELDSYIKELAKGKLKKCFCSNAGDEFGPVGKAFDEMAQTIRQVVNELQRLGRQLKESIHQTSQLMSDQNTIVLSNEKKIKQVDQYTQALTNRTQTFAQTMNELSTGSKQNTLPETAQQSLQTMKIAISSLCVRSANTLEHLKALKNKLEKGKNLFSFLTNVSNQAALLSLNSAIEASHVMTNKKTFVKITDEIQRFADKTDRSTQEMQKMIQGIFLSIDRIHKDTQNFFLDLNEISGKLKKVEQHLNYMALQIVDQTEKFQKVNEIMQEQAQIADLIKNFINDLVQLAQQNNHQIHHLGLTLHELSETAEKLQRVLNLFFNHKKTSGIKISK